MEQKCVHFCSYYSSSTIYDSLFTSLSKKKRYTQVVLEMKRKGVKFRPIVNDDKQYEKISFSYPGFLRGPLLPIRAFLSYVKLKTIFHKTALDGINDPIIHAHTLYSDGITAWMFVRTLPCSPFVITIRGTDINLWFKVMRPLKFFIKKVLRRATKIVFVCPQHKIEFIKYFGEEYSSRIEIIPNGINDSFIEYSVIKKTTSNTNLKVALYVGKATKNKNLLNALNGFQTAINQIKSHTTDWKFIFAGMTKYDFESVYGPLNPGIAANTEFIDFIESPVDLIKIYDSSDIFIMPSLSETFGLVYVEAISRCVPVVYMRGQGIDGYFEHSPVGCATRDDSPVAIANAITKCFELFPKGLTFDSNPANTFSWESVSDQYSALYAITNRTNN